MLLRGGLKSVAKLVEKEIATRLKEVDGWKSFGDAITKEFVLRDFPDAIAFAVRVAFGAEASDHHPDITVSYKRVILTYSTHSEGGITEKDFAGAKMADACVLD